LELLFGLVRIEDELLRCSVVIVISNIGPIHSHFITVVIIGSNEIQIHTAASAELLLFVYFVFCVLLRYYSAEYEYTIRPTIRPELNTIRYSPIRTPRLMCPRDDRTPAARGVATVGV